MRYLRPFYMVINLLLRPGGPRARPLGWHIFYTQPLQWYRDELTSQTKWTAYIPVDLFAHCFFQRHLSYDASSRPVTRLCRRHVRSRDQDPWSRGCSCGVRFAGFHFWELNGGEVEMCLRARQETWEIAGRGYPGNVRQALWRGVCWLTHWGRDDIDG